MISFNTLQRKKKENEDGYRKLIDWLPNPIIIHDNEIIIYVNEAAISMVNVRSKHQIISKSIIDFISKEYTDRVNERLHQIKKERQPLPNIEYKLTRFDGQSIFFDATSVLSRYEGKDVILTIGKDVTDQKKQTDSLLQKSEKLALVGQMAAGIAHEIRNPLTSIKGFIQLFRSNTKQKEYYDLVLNELERINIILGEFLVLAKPSVVVFKEIDVKKLIKDVVTLINSQLMLNNVQIKVEMDEHIPSISCEETQMKQVFINILKNSIEAMPNGGIIEIKVQEKKKGKLSICIIDQGTGIPSDRISTLGEPFYTTKEKGTGLGLMTCIRIIESHNGTFHISSELNKGTTVEITIPTITQPYIPIMIQLGDTSK
ncbi:ATP-binding protein [Heyndrickxia sporothermodurans]|uniref:histidine kinase n=1 Tax=Heyndrickxia sporothermodurans TaxID=46224 RepID=A0A150LFR7_9BACI|nr:hypothetical protein B4102_2263 [Heyndrickxia sporothermodurans]